MCRLLLEQLLHTVPHRMHNWEWWLCGTQSEIDSSLIRLLLSGNLRTVPIIVIAHTFCPSPNTRISYRQCLPIEVYFCAVYNYPEKVDLSKYSWYPKRKLGVTMHF